MVTPRRRSRLPRPVQEELVRLFVAGATARAAAEIAGVHRNTAALYFTKLREIIADRMEAEANAMLGGEIEADESYFGGVRKGVRGRGAAGKIPVFGLLGRGGRVYAFVVPSTRSDTIFPLIQGRVRPDSLVYTDGFRAYNVLDVSEFRHERVNKSEAFADGPRHINGIENFWNQAKRHLRRFNGIPRDSFPLFLKECEWRFNYRPTANLLRTLRAWASLE